MRTPTPSFLSARSLRSTLYVLATVGAASSLVGCTGDDTNPPEAPLPDAGPDATSADGGSKDSGTSTDSGSSTDSATPTDSGNPSDSAGQTG